MANILPKTMHLGTSKKFDKLITVAFKPWLYTEYKHPPKMLITGKDK